MKRWLPLVLIVSGIGLLYPMQRWIDRETPHEPVNEESLYFASGKTLKRISVGLEAILADIYWIRTVQYFGRKLPGAGEPFAGHTEQIPMRLLAPLLKIVVELDPGHIPAYRFGAIFLPERDQRAAIELLETGIRNNPDSWRLYQDLGYIYWQSGDYSKASEWYDRGGQIPGSAWFMRDLAGLMKVKGGSREVARQIFTQYLESEDRNIRAQAALRLDQLKMLDELDAINETLARYSKETGSCPANMTVLASKLYSLGLTINKMRVPIDPDGFDYVLDKETCTAKQSSESTVPR